LRIRKHRSVAINAFPINWETEQEKTKAILERESRMRLQWDPTAIGVIFEKHLGGLSPPRKMLP
jgi:hypothetical protein